MDYKTLSQEQLNQERDNIMAEISRRNDLADIPKQAETLAIRFQELGGDKSELAKVVELAEPATEEPAKTL